MAKSSIGTVESLKHDAKKSLANALEAEELHINEVQDNLFVGNQRGLDLASLAQRLDSELAARDLKITELDERLRYLLHSDDSYQLARARYLSTYKRDYLGTDTKKDRDIIADGNTTVHWGDARYDATLYTKLGRTDTAVFKKLYGLLPVKMDKISNDKTVILLNTHAGVLASDYKKGTRKFSTLFTRFVKALERSRFDETYPGVKDTEPVTAAMEVTIAYREFVDCIRKEVKAVRPKRR
ncbi:hypothetical protein HOY82DRAFT_483538 [Tuber indicum]|nr:hypothetical protein HOY82DRAFT_483538 [Tuber indicum]